MLLQGSALERCESCVPPPKVAGIDLPAFPPQAPTTTGRCTRLWTSAGSCCESSPRRCWRGSPRAPCPSSTPESPPAATRGRSPPTSPCPGFKIARGQRSFLVSPQVDVLVFAVYFFFFVERCVLIVFMSFLQCIVKIPSLFLFICGCYCHIPAPPTSISVCFLLKIIHV